jgi:hypothetical protein
MGATKEHLTKPGRRRGWRIFFTTFKWCRIAVLLLVLVVLVFGLFLNHVGLPEWLEQRVEGQFEATGWEVKFSRLRLRWYHGIVAEHLQLQRTNTHNGPHLFLENAEFRLNWKALQHLDLEADSVMLEGGRLLWPLPGTNQPQRTLVFDEIGGELIFKRGDRWELKFLQASVLGTQVRFRGDVTNASLIRDWRLPRLRPDKQAGDFWHHLLTKAERIRWSGRPELNTVFAGDARDWKTFEATTKFRSRGVESAWGGATNVSLTGQLLPPPSSNEAVRANVNLTMNGSHGPWGAATNAELSLAFEPSFTQLLPTNVLAVLELQGAETSWSRADRLIAEIRSSPDTTNAALHRTRFDVMVDGWRGRDNHLAAERGQITAIGVHPATNLFPAALETTATLLATHTPWATSRWTQVNAKVDLPALAQLSFGQTNRTWPERLANIPIQATATFSNVFAPGVDLDRAALYARWQSPDLELQGDTDLRDAAANIHATVQTQSGEVHFRSATRFSPKMLAPFLSTNAQPWLEVVEFRSPPQLTVQGRFELPVGSESKPRWESGVLPTLSLAGRIEAAEGSCRGVPFSSALVPFTFTNQIWNGAGIRVVRPEGSLDLAGSASHRTGDFEGTFHSEFNPLSLRPALPQPGINIVDALEITRPPTIEGVVRGNWKNLETLSARAGLVLTNAAFRGQAIQSCTAQVGYSNRFLSILKPVVIRSEGQGRADGIGIDLADLRLYLTNATGNLAPRAVTKAIGAGVDRAISPFVFDEPPASRAEGSVSFRKDQHAEDMRFEVDGGSFHWQRFHLERVKATLLWRGKTLAITNMQGLWRGADVMGSAFFQFQPKSSDQFSFHVRVQGADLRTILRDLQPGTTNKVEGTVKGELFITSANTDDWKSWQGYGSAQLTNGLLWEIPLFGVFSPVLNAFFPGLGNSRAKHATASFDITNSVIHTEDLEIRATAMRMNYNGTVDFEQRVEGRMEAELLRDLPAFGFLISKVFWPVTKLFEYRITGSLKHPKTEQVYIVSKIFILPFQPIKILKDLLDEATNNAEKTGESPEER